MHLMIKKQADVHTLRHIFIVVLTLKAMSIWSYMLLENAYDV
jgi:hypothetical protein